MLPVGAPSSATITSLADNGRFVGSMPRQRATSATKAGNTRGEENGAGVSLKCAAVSGRDDVYAANGCRPSKSWKATTPHW